MRRLILLFIITTSLESKSQIVTNLRAFDQGGKILVIYDLFNVEQSGSYLVKLWASNDGGKSYFRLDSVKGDVDNLVKVGSNRSILVSQKKIFLNGSKTLFKVEALPVINRYGDEEKLVQLHAPLKSDMRIKFGFILTNRTRQKQTYIIANFNATDEKGVVYKVSKGTAYALEPSESRVVSIEIQNVEGVSMFTKVAFNVSSTLVEFFDVKLKLE
jgi:hypothetical protein